MGAGPRRRRGPAYGAVWGTPWPWLPEVPTGGHRRAAGSETRNCARTVARGVSPWHVQPAVFSTQTEDLGSADNRACGFGHRPGVRNPFRKPGCPPLSDAPSPPGPTAGRPVGSTPRRRGPVPGSHGAAARARVPRPPARAGGRSARTDTPAWGLPAPHGRRFGRPRGSGGGGGRRCGHGPSHRRHRCARLNPVPASKGARTGKCCAQRPLRAVARPAAERTRRAVAGRSGAEVPQKTLLREAGGARRSPRRPSASRCGGCAGPRRCTGWRGRSPRNGWPPARSASSRRG